LNVLRRRLSLHQPKCRVESQTGVPPAWAAAGDCTWVKQNWLKMCGKTVPALLTGCSFVFLDALLNE
jgi:hypothetical protein